MVQQIQIQASEISKCLTFSLTDTMIAYDPVLQQTGTYPLATWENCLENDPRQTFEYNLSTNQIINPNTNLCLTPLPISTNFHPNLDGCDVWNSFDSDLSGAGTYLFGMECSNNDNLDVSQKFTYDSEEKSLISDCPHKLKLGMVDHDNVSSGYSSFLTAKNNTFPTAKIATGFDIPLFNHISIPQDKTSAVLSILSEFLGTEIAQKIVWHGCWCSKISGFHKNYAGQHVDEIDRLCKEWSYVRRCNGMVGGSCPHMIWGQGSIDRNNYYLIDRTNQNGIGENFSCETPEISQIQNQNDSCLRDTCIIDATFAAAIYNFLKANLDWDFDMESADHCVKSKPDGYNSENSHNQDPNFVQGIQDHICVGTAPDLEITVL